MTKPIDEALATAISALEVPAVNSNFHNVMTNNHGARISFGEGIGDNVRWRTAVMLSPADALLLARTIKEVFDKEPEMKAIAEARIKEIDAQNAAAADQTSEG